jgi:hypothetical protein
MDHTYFFFDRSAADSLWSLTWREYLRRFGHSRWAKRPYSDDGGASLRSLIVFSVDPEPSAEEVEEIIRHRTLRWTIERSAPQFFAIEQIVDNSSGLRRSRASFDAWPNDPSVLLAAAADCYFHGELPASEFRSVLKLHYSKFDDFVRLNRRELSAVRGLMDVDTFAKPIYPWQGEAAVLDEEWAGCLGVADTKGLFALINRLWRKNQEVSRILDVEDIDLQEFKGKTPRFRDFGISRRLRDLWCRKLRFFQQPCVVRTWG